MESKQPVPAKLVIRFLLVTLLIAVLFAGYYYAATLRLQKQNAVLKQTVIESSR